MKVIRVVFKGDNVFIDEYPIAQLTFIKGVLSVINAKNLKLYTYDMDEIKEFEIKEIEEEEE